MPRILVYGWLYVITPIHGGMAITLVHRLLGEKELFPLVIAIGFLAFGGAVAALWKDQREKTWKWAGRRLAFGYLLPLVIVAGAKVGVLTYEAGEFGRLGELSSPSSKVRSVREQGASAPPSLDRVPRILAAWLWGSATLFLTLVSATPLWLYLFALAVGLLRYER